MKRLLILCLVASLLCLNAAPALAAPPADTFYTVQPGDTLFGIALRFGTTVSALMQSNGLTSTLIFAGQRLRIPSGGGSVSSGGSSAGGSASGVCGASYAVQPGETLRTIALKCGTTIAAIAAQNGIVNIDLIFAGQVLKMPRSGGGASNPPPAAPPSATPITAPPPSTGGSGVCPAIYTIQRGDTLGIIANKCGVSAQAILAINTLANPSLIYPGQQLSIPGGQGAGSAPPAPPAGNPAPAATTPPPVPVSGSHGVTGQLVLCNPEKPSFAATIERICFHETITNTTGASVQYGILGVKATNLSGGPDQFQTSWRGSDLVVPPGGQGPAGGNWEDGIYITQPGTYRLQLAVCFGSVDGCLAGAGWELLTSGVDVKVIFWTP
jgi:LysM repeat protein